MPDGLHKKNRFNSSYPENADDTLRGIKESILDLTRMIPQGKA